MAFYSYTQENSAKDLRQIHCSLPVPEKRNGLQHAGFGVRLLEEGTIVRGVAYCSLGFIADVKISNAITL